MGAGTVAGAADDMKHTRLETNVPGDFFVDSSCIDCDACRWIAPATFDRAGEHSRVHRQPGDGASRRRALMALLACPTGSIRTEEKHDLKPVLAEFPAHIEQDVFHCGFHSEKSYGAASYFIQREQGNVLIDSPRFTAPLVRRLEALGGVDLMFLTHRDDVADHRRFKDHFGCRRVLHRADLGRATQGVEIVLEGGEPRELGDQLLAIPTPGHTEGSACLLYRDRFLFSGDHLAQNPGTGGLYAFRGVCWHDWRIQTESVARLQRFDFEWVLPGHGRRAHLDRDAMQAALRACADWMRRV